MSNRVKLYNSARYPTSLIIRGADELGIEIAKSLLEQGGYVIIIDDAGERSQAMIKQLNKYKLLTVLDYSAIDQIETELRRLDYVFYFQHKASNLTKKVSSQEFLQNSNYLDTILDISTKFESKFLLTTSIKAHQMNAANNQIDINYSVENDEKQSTYTELEIQRYSESLVKEYQEKVHLDARIIRLGIILGKAFDPEDKSILYKLINNALSGQDLLIPGDGLDNDYYIHYLDAAYGLIKAQFSLNTSGKTFSLCNDEQLSILSIAYKLLEIVPDAQDIKFDQNDNELPALRLYKPSNNLSEIGWKPRVSFDRALAQTIDEIKEIQNRVGIENYVNKENLKNIDNESKLIVEPKDALSRLIAERKTQQNARLGSIILANKNIKDNEKSERNKGFFRKIDISFNNFLFMLKRRMSFLRNMTLTDFIAWILIITALGIIYFVLVAPGIALFSDIYQVRSVQANLQTSLTNSDYSSVLTQSNSMVSALKDAQLRLSDIRYIFNITNSEDQYSLYQKTIDEYMQLFEGMESSMDPLLSYKAYLEAFNPNITYRYADSSILTVGSEVEYDAYLTQMKNKYYSFKINVDKTSKAADLILETDNTLPSTVKDMIGLNKESLSANVNDLKAIVSLYNYLPTLVGYQQARNYLFIIQDNARYTAAGGEIAGYIIVQFRNGAIKDIKVKTATNIDSTAISVSKDALDEINLMTSVDKNSTNLIFKDLSLISNQKLFLTETESAISSLENVKIDMAISLDLKYIESLISVYGPITYKDTIFTQENLLDKINTTVDTTRTLESRNDIIINLFSSGLEKAFNNFSTTFSDLIKATGQSSSEFDFKFYSTDPIFSTLSALNPLFMDQTNVDYLMAGSNYKDDNLLISKYPVNTVGNTLIKILPDNSTKKTVEISTDGIENLENNYLCLPSGATHLDISNIPADIISKTYTNDMLCYTFIKSQQTNHEISYSTLPLNSSLQDNIYTFNLYSNTGLSTNYDIEFDFDSSLGSIEPINNNYIIKSGNYIYTGRSTGFVQFSFKIIKNG